jgi:tripartite-type tricarboxylate transporter receptor subunit TctC
MRCAGPFALLVLATCAVTATAAEVFPTRPIRLIVGYPPGGSTDIAARLIALKLAPLFGQTVVVDNRSGASGTIGAGLVVKSEPDGHTLSFAASPEVGHLSRADEKSTLRFAEGTFRL